MRWDESVRCVLPAAAADSVIADIRRGWAGSRIYVTMRAARLDFKETGPDGAAETFAFDVCSAVIARGGSMADVRAILLPLAGGYQEGGRRPPRL